MASNSETGHAKNIANFEDLISFCIGYGAAYNPANANILVAALQTKLTAANTALLDAKVSKTAFDNATNAREVLFQNLKKLSTRIVNALEATTAADQTVDDAKTVNRKIQGKRADNTKGKTTPPPVPAPTPEPEPTHKQISVSQQSFDSQVDNFTKLIQVISTEAAYAPNENELKAATLNTQLAGLKTANTAVINVATGYSNARITRNDTLYKADTGLVFLAGEVKKYVKSLFGATSSQFKQVSGLQFKNLIRK